jgi:hypothetical protein
MLELKKRELQFKLDDQVYKLKFPSVSQVREYAKKFEKEEDSLKCIIDFLSKLGLPKEVTEDMEVNHLETIMTEITKGK